MMKSATYSWALSFVLVFGLVTGCASSSPSSSTGEESKGTLSSNDEPLWVVQQDGSQSCKADSGKSLVIAKQELEKIGVHVMDQRKSHDGKMHVQVCGAKTGFQNAFKISSRDLSQAEKVGYSKAKEEPRTIESE